MPKFQFLLASPAGTTKIAETSTEERALWVVLDDDLDNQPIWSSAPNFGAYFA